MSAMSDVPANSLPVGPRAIAKVNLGVRRYAQVPWALGGVLMAGILDEDKRKLIAQACERFGVSRMHLFGSALRADFQAGESDVDLLVEFAPMTPHELVDAYFDLLDELRSILGAQVDLVMADAVKNRYIAAEIERTKQALYAA